MELALIAQSFFLLSVFFMLRYSANLAPFLKNLISKRALWISRELGVRIQSACIKSLFGSFVLPVKFEGEKILKSPIPSAFLPMVSKVSLFFCSNRSKTLSVGRGRPLWEKEKRPVARLGSKPLPGAAISQNYYV